MDCDLPNFVQANRCLQPNCRSTQESCIYFEHITVFEMNGRLCTKTVHSQCSFGLMHPAISNTCHRPTQLSRQINQSSQQHQPHYRQAQGFSQGVVCSSHESTLQEPSTTPVNKSIPSSSTWEIDFCSRPLLDDRGKKVWELLVCNQDRSFEYTEYFPNSKINSAEVSVSLGDLSHTMIRLALA